MYIYHPSVSVVPLANLYNSESLHFNVIKDYGTPHFNVFGTKKTKNLDKINLTVSKK